VASHGRRGHLGEPAGKRVLLQKICGIARRRIGGDFPGSRIGRRSVNGSEASLELRGGLRARWANFFSGGHGIFLST